MNVTIEIYRQEIETVRIIPPVSQDKISRRMTMARSRCSVSGKNTKKRMKPVNQDVSLKESVFHGSALFPAAIYDDDLTLEEVIWHWHEEFEAGWITEGRIIVDGGNTHITLERGQGFFVNSGVIHAMRNADPGKPAGLHSIAFHPSIVSGASGSIYEQKYVLPVLHDPFLKLLVMKMMKSSIICRRHGNSWIRSPWIIR